MSSDCLILDIECVMVVIGGGGMVDPKIWLEVRRYGLFGECECDVILHVGDKEYDEDVLDRVLNDEVVRKRIMEILKEVRNDA